MRVHIKFLETYTQFFFFSGKFCFFKSLMGTYVITSVLYKSYNLYVQGYNSY